MFENRRTGAKATELRAYRTESEIDAKRRLEAGGWTFSGVEYDFEDFAFKVSEGAPSVEESAKEED
jgi:hypothetical protein